MDMAPIWTLHEGGRRNFIKLLRLMICEGVEILRNLFAQLHPPASALKIYKGRDQKRGSLMFSSYLLNIPLSSQCDSSIPLDTTVHWFVCCLREPKAGWELPDDKDFSLRADLARIMVYRNTLVEYGMGKKCRLTKRMFENYWQKIQSALTRIVRDYSGTDFEAVSSWEKRAYEYRTVPVTEEDERNWEKLKWWHDMDKRLRCSENPEDVRLNDEIEEMGCTRTEKKEVTSPEHDLVQHNFSWNSEKRSKKCMKLTCLKSCLWTIDESDSICLLRTLRRRSKSRFTEELEYKPEEILEMVDEIAPKYYFICGTKALDSGRYSVALCYFNRSLKSSPDKELLFRATLENNIGCTLMIEKECAKASMTFRRHLQIMNCKAFENEANELVDMKSRLLTFCFKNNYGCAELDAGNCEEALSVFKSLYDETQIKSCGNSEQWWNRSLMPGNVPDVPVENRKEPCSSHLRYSDKLFSVSVVLKYSQACLLSGNLDNVVDVLQDILNRCQFSEHEFPLQQMISARLARIWTLQGKRRKVDEILDQQRVDRLTIQKVLEGDSFGPFTGMYTEDLCRILVYRGERTKSRELLLLATQECQQMNSNRNHPMTLSLEKTTEELFPTQVIEKANSSTDLPLYRPCVVTNVFFEYAMQVLKDEELRESLVRELDATKTTPSYEKCFADMYASEKQMTPSPEVTVVSTVCLCAFLSQQGISGTETEPYLEKQLAKITSLKDVLKETLVSKTTISFLCDYESCFMAALCSLLETALLRRTQTWVNKICEPLVSFLALRAKDEGNEMEWYKDYCGLLSYFVSVDHSVSVPGGEISLYVIVTCGSGLHRSKDAADVPEGDPLFIRLLNDAETDERGTSYLGRRSRYFVFLRSNNLIDINELRKIKKTITESFTCLEVLSVNAVYQGSVFIDVVPEIDPRNLQDLCLNLYSLRACLVKNKPGPVRTPSTQSLYLQKLQKQLTFEEEENMELFIAVFQHTFHHLQMVHVRYKTRKKFVCIFKDPPFSLMTLHARSTGVLTLHDVTDTCLTNGVVTNDLPKLIDDVIKDCCNKLNFKCTSESRGAWCGAVAVQNHESEDDNDLEKAQKANARLTLELEYLKGKVQRLADRTRGLLDKLSEMGARAFLYQQHFVHTISSDKNKTKAVENWIAHRKNSTGDEDDNEDGFNLEECLESISNDELVEMLADIHRPDLVQTRDKAEETCQEKKYEGAIGISSYKEPQIYNDDDSEGKSSSNRPCWQFPLSEVAVKTFIKEECTQTDSLSWVDEHTLDQTEPSPLTNDESLGQANFERDRAERQLQRLRVAYDIHALRRSSRGRNSGSSRDSIVSTTPCQGKEVISSDGTFQELNVSGSKSAASKYSLVSEISRQDPENISSDSASQESNDSEYWPKSKGSKYSVVSGTSRQDPENISSDSASQESNDSEYWPKSKGSKYSVVSGTSRQDPENISSDSASQESNDSEYWPMPKASKYSVASGTSRQDTESISSEETKETSNVSQLLSVSKTSKDSIASETSSQETEGISIEDTLQESNLSQLLLIPKTSKDSIASRPSSGVSLSSNSKASLGTPPDSISPDFMPKQDSDTTETVSNGRKPSVDESSSGISSIKEPNFIILIDQNNENRHPAIPDSKMWLYDTEEYGGRDDEMNASMMLGAEHLKKEEYDDAITYSKKCLGIAQECGDKEAEMNAYYTLGNAYLNTGQRSGAVLYGERCLDIAREYGNKVDEMNAFLMLGIAHSNREEYDDAISYSEKCLAIAQECGDKATQTKAYRTLGEAHLNKEKYDDAISYSKKCLTIAQECGDKETKMNAYNTLGNAHLKKEEYDDAISYSKKSLDIAQECGDKETNMNAYNTLGNAHLKKEEYDDAISYSKKCLDIAQECGDKVAEMNAYKMLGDAYSQIGEYDDAISYIKKHLDIAQECGDKVAEMNAYRTLENALKDNDLIHAMSSVNRQKGVQPPSQWKEGEYLDMVDGRQSNQNRTFYKPVLLTSEQMVSTQSLFEERTKASGKSGVRRKFGAKIKTNEKQAGDSELLEENDDSRCMKFSRDCEIATTTKQNLGCDVNGDNRGICEDFGTRKDDENMTSNAGLESTGVLNSHGARTRRDLKALEGNYDSEVCNSGTPSKKRARSSITSICCKTRTGLFEQVESDGGEVRLKESASVVPPRKFAFDDVACTSHYDVHHIMPRDVASQLSESRVARDVTSTSGYETPREVLTQLKGTRSVDVLINHERDESGNMGKFEIAAAAPRPEVHEILKAYEHEKSLDKECFKSPDNFQVASKLRMNEECKAIGTAKEDFLASNENSETSSSFENVSEYLSLPCSFVPRNRIAAESHDALCTTERTRPGFSTESQNKMDDTCRESLSVIKEIDDSQETASNRVWDLQGARPKIQNNEPLIEERSDFIVPGVDSSFLARHSIYSRAMPDYGAFLSLPAISERRTFPSLARTWPISNEREGTLPASSISLLGQSLRSTHDQQSSTSNTDNTVGSSNTDESCPSGVKMRLRSSKELGSNGNNLFVGQETSLGNPHPKENVTVNSSGFVKDQGADQTAEQSIDPFDQIVASQFALTSESRYGNILHEWTNNQNSSGRSSMESFNTADSSLHSSLQSLEEKIETTCMTLSQMSESALFDQELERQHPDDEHQTKNDNETILVACIDQNIQRDGENEDISEGDGKGKSGWNNELEGGRAEEETREPNSNNFHSQQSIIVQESGVHAVNLAAALTTSLSTQRVSAKTYETLERERRKAVAQEREELRKKEEAENKRRLQASKVEQERRSSLPRPASLPVQESTEEGPCSHYKRKCLVRFDCCEEFYPCHRCHNNSDQCQEENKKALNSTLLKCLNCLTEQEITKDSHHCKNCNIQLSDYFCGICKHFTGIEKKPYHCEHCGICRVHRDRSFHCKVCNVCLDNRLYNNHKCRENSGHDECCICLEDAFGGCQILPCSHKVHRECAVAMLKNGVRKCPICRCPLYQ